jgi:hypothetical protein
MTETLQSLLFLSFAGFDFASNRSGGFQLTGARQDTKFTREFQAILPSNFRIFGAIWSTYKPLTLTKHRVANQYRSGVKNISTGSLSSMLPWRTVARCSSPSSD